MKDHNSRDVCVISVAYNEEDSIESVIKKIIENFDGPIIVVNDGSTDKTPFIIEKLAEKYLNIYLLNHPINIGPFFAIHTGIQYALKIGCKFFVDIDADGQHPPEYIHKVLDAVIKNEADLVIGSRYLSNTNYLTSITRSLGIKGSSKAVSIFGGIKITDVTSGYRAYNLKCAKMMLSTYLNINTVFEFTLRFCRKGFRVKEIPIPMNQRLSGTSYLNYWRLFLYPFRISLEIIKSIL